MCRFYFAGIMFHEALRGFDYYLRMDTDSCFIGRMPDWFRYLDDHPGVVYLAAQSKSNNMYLQGLAALATSFAQRHSIALDEPLEEDGNLRLYYVKPAPDLKRGCLRLSLPKRRQRSDSRAGRTISRSCDSPRSEAVQPLPDG